MLYKKKISISMILGLMLVLVGCGDISQPIVHEEGPVQVESRGDENLKEEKGKEEPIFVDEKGQILYYILEEQSLPNPDRQLKNILKDEKYTAKDPILHKGTVYRYIIVFDEEGNHKDYYLQTLKLSEKEWRWIPASEAFVIDGKEYSMFKEPFVSEGDGVYCYVSCTEEKKTYLGRLGENGVEEVICPVSSDIQRMDEEHIGYEGKLAYDKEGNFYFFYQANAYKEWNDFVFLDAYTQVQKEKQLEGKIRNIVETADSSKVYWYGVNRDDSVIIRNIMSTEIMLDNFEGVDGYECEAKFSTSNICYLADRRSIWKVSDGKAELIFDFLANDYIVDDLYTMEAGENSEIRMLVELDGGYSLLELKGSEVPVEKEKLEITLALAREHMSLQKEIVRFNRKSDKYYVTLLMPEYGENEREFRERIQMEVSVGKGPDIMGHDVILDISPYVENDYLVCLDGLLNDESQYLTAALEGCRIDGSLYGIPYDCSLKFVSYPKLYAGGQSAWTIEEFMQAVERSDAKILQADYDGLDIVKYYGLYDDSNASYIDWKNGKSHLNEKPFLELLAFAKKYADTGLLDGEAGELVVSKEAFAAEVTMNSMRYIYYLYNCFEGEPAMIGFPREIGNGIYVSSREMYINNSSACIDGAKEFLKYLLSEEVQMRYVDFDVYEEMSTGSYRGHVPQFPVYLDAYEVLVEKAEKAKGNVSGNINGVFYEEEPLSAEQVKSFYALLENTQSDNSKATSIFGMVEEELAPYFAGEITAERAAQILDNRVQLYLDERADY